MTDAWYDEAVCKGEPSESFYPAIDYRSPSRLDPDHEVWAAARALCDVCPVGGPDGPCLEAALKEVTQDGMRAGLTPDQRRALIISRGRQRRQHVCGTPGGYTYHGCREAPCREAYNRVERERAMRRRLEPAS